MRLISCATGRLGKAIISLEILREVRDIIAMKTIVFTHQAAKDLDAIEPKDRETILTALASYAVSGRGDAKRLYGRDGCRLRIGRYRVIFQEDAMTILAVYVGNRETTTYRRN